VGCGCGLVWGSVGLFGHGGGDSRIGWEGRLQWLGWWVDRLVGMVDRWVTEVYER
jgi:hypothetical protein